MANTVKADDRIRRFRLLKWLWRSYIRKARLRNIFWGLTLEEFILLVTAPCGYCGRPPYQKRSILRYTGVDRKDNKQGYTRQNSGPCCGECNRLKSNLLTAEETKAAMDAIMALRKKAKKP